MSALSGGISYYQRKFETDNVQIRWRRSTDDGLLTTEGDQLSRL